MKPVRATWAVEGAVRASSPRGLAEAVLRRRGLGPVEIGWLLRGGCAYEDARLLPGLGRAADVVCEAVEQQRRGRGGPIGIYGDYDADGVTACAMLTRTLRAGGADVLPYIPNRMTEGYGLHAAALEELAAQGVRCVVTVDCGTSSHDAAAARPRGMRLVITDHHLPLGGGRLPAADAIVNPKVTGAPHPFDGLSGAGVAWKLLCELERRGVVLSGSGAQAVGLAAIGTVCDVMPLVGENRSIVERGLEQLSECPPIGLGSLIERLGLRRSLLASDLGFLVGPHLNAAGRMGDARVALDLCLASSPATAEALADELVVLNAERKRAVEEACVEAEDQVATLDEDAACVVVGSRRWSAGIVGLVAARLVERYGRPAVAVAVAEPWGRGSARSTADVNVTEALCEVPAGVLGRFGGHRAAAGLSVREGDIPRLREALDRAVRIQGFAVGPEHEVDAVVPLSAVTASLLAEVSRLEPCGAGNPAVLLAALGCRVVAARGLGAGGRHLSIELDAGGAGARVRGVAWNRPLLVSQVAQHLPPGRRVDILFTVGSAWNGRGVEVQLRDIRAEAARPWDRREALPTEEAGEAELPLGEVPQGVR